MKTMTSPNEKNMAPIIGRIQCTDGYIVHANRNRPIGRTLEPAMAVRSLDSGLAARPFASATAHRR